MMAHARFRRLRLLVPALFVLSLCVPAAQGDRPFLMVQVDAGAAESAALADFNNDGKLDIVSAESWYEAPGWTKRPIRTIPVSSGYIDSFSDLPIDVDGDKFTDVIQIGYFAKRIVWMKNPGPGGGAWTEHLIDAIGPTEFAFLVDLDNDGKTDDLLPQFNTPALPLTWYDLQNGTWVKHIVSARSYGHGIGAGDINGDKRNDIVTPQGWLEAPADPRAAGDWTFHPADWQQRTIPAPAATAPSLTTPPAMAPLVTGTAAAVPPAAAPGTAAAPAGARGAEWGFLYVIDINGDGRNDVLTTSAHSYGICWFEQRADGGWQQHVIDHSWSHAHASVLADINGDGRPDLVTGKRFQSRNQPAPGDSDPLGIYWYEFRQGATNTVSWTRHTIDYGSKAGGGVQMAVRDIDGDGDMDVLSSGKSGLFLAISQARRPAPRVDLLQDSLKQIEPQPIYAADPRDAWNQVFFLLFTRAVDSRVMAAGANVFAAGDERLALSTQRISRVESGDRAIDPMYPSWLWMGSRAFDFDPNSVGRVLREPRYSQLVGALEKVRHTAGTRPPLARALMQADLWSAYDMLHEAVRTRPGPTSPDGREREQRARDLLSPLALTMRALALSADEISRLPDTYSMSAASLGLPDLLGRDDEWMEIRWMPHRSHDSAAGLRRAARVFVRPADPAADATALLNRLRYQQGSDLGALESVALLIQLLLVRDDGTVVPSPITYEAQFRGRAARPAGVAIPQYDLGRRQVLASPAAGLVRFAADSPAYLPMAGNDFSFATPPRLDGAPVLAPLSARCAACHGPGLDVGHLGTFSKHSAPGVSLPPVERLARQGHVHASDVAGRKMARDDFLALRQLWK